MKRFVVVTLLVLAVVQVFGQAKWGGIARQISMGGASAGTGLVINPYIWEDPANLLVNPAYQCQYKDYFWTNIGGGLLTNVSTGNNGYGLQNAGISFAIDSEWGVGAILSYDPSFVNVGSTLIGGIGGLGLPLGAGLSIAQRGARPIPQVRNVWEVFGSYDGSGFDAGFGLLYGSSRADTVTTTATTSSDREASASVIGFRAGAIVDLGSDKWVDIGAMLRIDKARDRVTQTPAPTTLTDGDYSVSGTELQVQARGKLKLSSRVNLVPFVVFATLSGEPQEDAKPTAAAAATPRTLKASATSFAFGAGTEIKTSSVFLACGLSFFTGTVKAEYSTAAVGTAPAGSSTIKFTNTAIPVINLGAEWWFLDWLAGRAGYYRSIAKTKATLESVTGGATTTIEVNFSTPTGVLLLNTPSAFEGTVSLGLGLRFGNFSLDATVSEEALRRGFGLIGSNDNLNSFGYMNASFNFQ